MYDGGIVKVREDAFVVHFKSKEDHDLYQEDSLHLQFIADYKTYWRKLQIYDNLVSDKVVNP